MRVAAGARTSLGAERVRTGCLEVLLRDGMELHGLLLHLGPVVLQRDVVLGPSLDTLCTHGPPKAHAGSVPVRQGPAQPLSRPAATSPPALRGPPWKTGAPCRLCVRASSVRRPRRQKPTCCALACGARLARVNRLPSGGGEGLHPRLLSLPRPCVGPASAQLSPAWLWAGLWFVDLND